MPDRLRIYPHSLRDTDAGEQVINVVTSHEGRTQGERPFGSRQNEANSVEAMVDSMGLQGGRTGETIGQGMGVGRLEERTSVWIVEIQNVPLRFEVPKQPCLRVEVG